MTRRRTGSGLGRADILDAERRLGQFASLLSSMFPELQATHGIIESALVDATPLRNAMVGYDSRFGEWLIKSDHALPVAGSIKARGGIYEVLLHAESLASRAGLIAENTDRRKLAEPVARNLFEKHAISVGSTGNLGLSIGIMGAALGFQTTVHMSSDAKRWKKDRLRARGVNVVEHEGDFGDAVAAGRAEADSRAEMYFVDDENSRALFLGYSVAASRLAEQLAIQGVTVDADHPLFVYIPCGVGGAPGGICFGLRHVFGDHVHCFAAEPVAAPAMLAALAIGNGHPISVRSLGLEGRTEADGLAVGRASKLVAPIMRGLLSGVFTVADEDLFEDLWRIEQVQGLKLEPSAAAGFRGPEWIVTSDAGRAYQRMQHLETKMTNATHILWTTGGAFVPDEEYRDFHTRGAAVAATRPNHYHAG